MTKKIMHFFILAVILAVVLTACQDKSSQPNITIEKPWAPPSPPSAESGAFYMLIRNIGPADRLVSAGSESCGRIEIHQSSVSEDDVMSMHKMSQGLIIPAKGKVELKPGGVHLMCIDKKTDFVSGGDYKLTLFFEKNGPKTIGVEIKNP